MAKLFWDDLFDYFIRLYVRASWRLQGLMLAPSVRLQYQHRSQIEVKGRCSIGAYSVVFATATKESERPPLLIIGENTYVGDLVNLRAAGGVIRLGRDVLIGNHVTIVASNHGMRLGIPMIKQSLCRGDVLIEDDVWIGAGVVILPGAVVRQGAIVAAGAVVVKGEVPSGTIYGGVPARQIGVRS